MIENPHIADRPSWNCRSCGRAWPCHPARAHLWVEFRGNPTALRIYLVLNAVEAARDLPEVDRTAIDNRFVGWAAVGGYPGAAPASEVPATGY